MDGCLLVIFVLSAFLLVELEAVLAMGGCLLVIFVLSAFLLVEFKVVLAMGGCVLVIFVHLAFLKVELEVVSCSDGRLSASHFCAVHFCAFLLVELEVVFSPSSTRNTLVVVGGCLLEIFVLLLSSRLNWRSCGDGWLSPSHFFSVRFPPG
jgi:hypothetical protein